MSATITSLDEVRDRQRVRLASVGFVEGHGERRDECSAYTKCLGDWTRMHRTGQAMCQPGCEGYSARDRRRDVDLAASARDGEGLSWG